MIATGFNRNHRMVTEGGSIDEEWRVENVVDRVETSATAFLGLTIGCARCHDHKYDPLSKRDFYSFYAFFNNVDEQGVYTERRGNVPPMIQLPTPEQSQRLAGLEQKLADVRRQLETADEAASLPESSVEGEEAAPSEQADQPAAGSAELREQDPSNRLLARGPRRRLSAEMIRDNALSVAGLRSEKMGGPSVKPYQPDGLWDELAGGANGGPSVLSDGEDLYRRSLYTFRKRTVSHPTLATFDTPSWETCQAKRGTTNTPLQSLALLNDTTYAEAAAHLAMRMQKAAPEDASALLAHGGSPVAEDRRTPELAALAAVAAVMLNLDETLSR